MESDLSGVGLELEAHDVVGHLDDQSSGVVIVLHHVANLQETFH